MMTTDIAATTKAIKHGRIASRRRPRAVSSQKCAASIAAAVVVAVLHTFRAETKHEIFIF